MLDAFTRAMRKPQQMLGYIPGLTAPAAPSSSSAAAAALPAPPGTRLRREPDGPVSFKVDPNTNMHVPSPFRIG